HFLERDETIDLNVLLLASDPEYSEQDRYAIPTFPASRDALFAYDVILVGDVDPGYLTASQMNMVAEFVAQKGGGVLFCAGQEFTPWAFRNTPFESLLPIELSEARDPSTVGQSNGPYRPLLTPEGRTSPIFRLGLDQEDSLQVWTNLPEQLWFLEAART